LIVVAPTFARAILVGDLEVPFRDDPVDAGQGTCPWAAGLVTLIPTVFIVRTLKFWRFVCPVDPSGAAKLGHRTKRRAVGLLG